MDELVGAGRGRQPGTRWVRKLAWLVIPLGLFGEAGHQLLERFGQTVAHHFFHVVFVGAAALIFGGFVATDVRRYGWPRFSWKLRPRPESSSGREAAVRRERGS